MSSDRESERREREQQLRHEPPLDHAERKQVVEEEKINAAVTHEVVRREGIKELHRRPPALAWSGLAAGVSMGLILLTTGVLHHALPEAPWRHLIASLGYSTGFLAVILGSQQLYTENTLTPIVPLMSERTGTMLRKVLVLWGVVLVANLVGTVIFAWAAARTAALPPEVRQSMRTVALEATRHDWVTVFARGIVAGWIIALMVWMLPAASSSQVTVIIVMTWLVGAAELSHVIVTSVEAFYLVALGDMGVGRALGGQVLPALIGNTLGGVILVAALNHAQVEAD
jgi:formate-nitrite transporter family protein